MKRWVELSFALAASFCFVLGCSSEPPGDGAMDDGPVAEGISGALGEVMPSATPSQVEAFERGRVVMARRFDLSDGLGPSFNIASCGGCHEKPTLGGSAGLYRNFFLGAVLTDDGAFLFSESAGDAGGVLRMFRYALDGLFRPAVPNSTNIFAQRNSIPIFGAGLIAALSDEEILSREDEADSDGDGISGRANFDRDFVGRFGRKAQVVSIEAFIRGPLFNHLGITTEPLTAAQRAQLPVDSALAARIRKFHRTSSPTHPAVRGPHQVAAPEEGTTDSDDAADPEMNGQDLFDLISFVMLLAAPQLEEPTAQSNRGRLLFHQANCSACHTPRLQGPSGPIPIYSDLLLHDMGTGLADRIEMGEKASGSEFRTQPLWGIAATGPHLHDGRESTIAGAILAHGGEAQASRDAFDAMSSSEQDDVVEFLMSLGGRAQASEGLLEPNAPMPGVKEYGGPFRELTSSEQAQFLRGRAVFDRDFGFDQGAGAMAVPGGAPRFNGDSCRACHSDPVIGGAGPRGVNVMRHGRVDSAGVFSEPPTTPNTILHKQIVIGSSIVQPEGGINVFEHRQAPHTFGLGLIDAISEETILSNADPDDADGDGISGRAHILRDDDRIGRLGWKADVPNVAEFVRDAMAAEIGLTIPQQTGLTFGLTTDDDGITDPELSIEDAEDLAFFLSMLAGPPRQPTDDQTLINAGEALFASVGCAKCHIPSLPSSEGDVDLFSDLLLHEILPAGARGIESGEASQREFRTAPLWGLSQTAPYFHSGEADTIHDAILLHDGEAVAGVQAYVDLSASDQQALLAFLNSL